MATPNDRPVLRLLVVEDREEDAELMVQQLQESGLLVEWQRVDTREDYLAALSSPVDVILADYTLPRFDVPQALALLQELGLDTPLIVVSGTIGEETAVEALSLGAADYLLKDRLTRLGRAVERALGDARRRREKRQADLALQDSIQCFEGFVQRSSEGIVLCDESGRVIVWNQAQADIVGIPADEAIGQPLWEVQSRVALPGHQTPEERRRLEAGMRQALDSGVAEWDGVPSSMEIERPDGSRRHIESVAFLFPSATGFRAGSITRDVTQRKRSERVTSAQYEIAKAAIELDEPQALYRAVHANVATLMPAASFHIAIYDPRLQSFTFPYFSNQMHSAPAPRTSPGAKTEYVMRSGRPLLASADTLAALERQGEMKLTGTQPVSYLGVPLITDQGPIGVVSVQSYDPGVEYTDEDRDILAFMSTQIAVAIQRHAAREEVIRTRDFYVNLIDEFPTPVWRTNPFAVHDYFSKSWLAFTGRALSDELGDGWLAGVHPDDAPARSRAFAQAVATRQRFEIEYRLRHHSGEYRWVLDVGHPFYSDGSFAGYIGTCYDITERKLAEEALRDSERKLRGLIDSSSDGIALEDENGVVVEWNPAMERITGIPQERLLGRPLWDEPRVAALLEDGRPDYRQVGAEGTPSLPPRPTPNAPRDIHYLTPSHGAGKTVRVLSFPVPTEFGVMVGSIARDVTDELALSQRLARGERLESIGRLAGGIAHDLNNLITVLVGHADFAKSTLAPGDAIREDLEQILSAADRAAGLTRQLLAFSRRQPMESKLICLNDLFLGLEGMLRRLIREDILLLASLAPDVWPIEADPGQIEQVIINLVINSRDAMPAGGTITIETANATLDQEYAHQHPDAAPGDYVALTVSDTGSGMSEEVMEHIFEPFFTTKESGRGTGLGLATVFGIVRQHRGHLWYHSELGRGSTFRVYLPRASGAPQPQAESVTEVDLPRGNETIMVVEDEPAVRHVTCRTLESLGYSVVAAANGAEALRLAQEDERHIDLLVTDAIMPQIGGQQLALCFEARRPGTRVLLVSGYQGDTADAPASPSGNIRFLPKPFTRAQLATAVRAALDGTTAPM